MTLFFIVAVSVLFAVIRLTMPLPPTTTKNRLFDSYKAFAHLWVGSLFGTYMSNGNGYVLTTAIVLSLVEVFAFLIGRLK